MLALVFVVFALGAFVDCSPPAPTLDLFQSLTQEIARTQSKDITPVALNGVDLQSTDLFEQLLEIPRLDKLCKTYTKEKHDNQGVDNLLQLICKKRNQLLKQSADCLSGMANQLRPSCERVCIQKQEARVENLRDECGLAICVGRCVDVQMSECFAEVGVEPAPGQVPVGLYSEVMASMVSTGLNAKNDEEMMEKMNGMLNALDTCAEFLQIPIRVLRTPQSMDGTEQHKDNQF
ncbi:hypothetical protein M3Y97_00131700 [Aphelenchoides bicaudatus]|nr:hypothetical protein M3Y97_00131700 [Aphelenchoides bicaudatus]